MTNEELLQLVKELSWQAMDAYDEDEPEIAVREYKRGYWDGLHELMLQLNLEVTGKDIRVKRVEE